MKNTFILFFALLGLSMNAQIQKLNELSSSKLLDSRIVYEENSENVFGYFLLFEKDKTSKEESMLEYSILDKNLNKLTSGTFSHPAYSNFLVKTSASIVSVVKHNNTLFFATGLNPRAFGQTADFSVGAYYRTLDLTNFKLSDSFSLVDFNKVEKVDMVKLGKSITTPQVFVPTKCNGYLVNQTLGQKGGYDGPIKLREFRFYDKDLNEKWTFKFNQGDKDKSITQYYYMNGEGNDLVFSKYFYKKSNDSHPLHSLEVIDASTGKEKFELKVDDSKHIYRIEKLEIVDDAIVVVAKTNNYKKKASFRSDKVTGYAKISFDRKTGKELSRDLFAWSALAEKYKIKKYGKIRSYGYIEFIDFKLQKDGKMIVIGEGYKPSKHTRILDLFAFVFDGKMNLVEQHKIDKVKNKIRNVNAWGGYLNDLGAFDYKYSQSLPNDGSVFFYIDNEKTGFFSESNPKKVLGIVTYADGKFDFQKIPLKTKEGKINPIKAKEGYILLQELSEDQSELRLEKIDY